MKRIDEIKDRWKKVTPGPWWSTRDLQPAGIYSGEGSGSDVCVADVFSAKDAHAIANAPADIAALTSALDAVWAVVGYPGAHGDVVVMAQAVEQAIITALDPHRE